MSSIRKTLFLLVASTPLLFTVAHAGEAAPRIVQIGFAGPLMEADAISAKNTASLAVMEANKSNLRINGQKIIFTLIAENDRADKHIAEHLATYFVKSNVVGVVGHWSSDAAMAASPIYAQAGVAQLLPIGWIKQYTQQGFKTTFQMVGDDEQALRYTAEHLTRQLHLKRFLVIDDSAMLGASMAEHFIAQAQKVGADIVRHTSTNNKTSDFNVPLEEAKKIRPDLIFFSGRLAQSKLLISNLKRLQISADLLITGTPTTNVFLQGIDDMNHRLYAIVVGSPTAQLPGVDALKKRYAAQFGSEMLPFSVFAYDSVNVLIAAIKKANSVDRDRVVDALHKIQYNGITGNISFDATGAISKPSYTLYELKNHEWSVVKVFKKNH